MTLRSIFTGLIVLLCSSVPTLGQSPAVPVELSKTPTGHRLLRGGKPFFVQGAGGTGSLQMLHDVGANSVRTWGAEALESTLNDAEKLNMTVAAGIWLGHARHGFNYDNPEQVEAQFQRAKAVIDQYKDHPALLVWSIGNEMDGYKADGGDPKIWAAVERIAAYAKQVDPKHPTMTVVAEILPKRVASINNLCPSIDIVGINTYAGCKSVGTRYREAGGVKPYIVTEFGPPGTWEVEKNAWGAVPEPTSTEKAEHYRISYEQGVLAEKDKLCLGSFAFVWGSKQEATSTWFGMFLPDGSRTASVDVMQKLWSGKDPANRVPAIHRLSVPSLEPAPGETMIAKVDAADPENDPLRAEWVLMEEAAVYGVGGDEEPVPFVVKGAVTAADAKQATIAMPSHPGRYRLFLTLRDDHGGAATANVSIRIPGDPVAGPRRAPPASLPLVIYDDGFGQAYAPSGWIGKTDAILLKPDDASAPHAGRFSLRCEFDSRDNFGGVVWQSPVNDWGDVAGGFDLTGARQLSFWARGSRGDEVVDFALGVLEKEKTFADSSRSELKQVHLTNQWKQYTIDLTDKDLSVIKTGFSWSTAGRAEPVVFYLDQIQVE